ncbi:sodium-dependent multivitamin transporter-like [Glandiceps talaboti]
MASDDVIPFGVVDYIVFSGLLIVSVLIGIYHSISKGGQRSTSTFLVADRSMTFLPIAMSILVSFTTPITILGFPAEVFIFGLQYSVSMFSKVWSYPLIAYFCIPVFHGLKFTSAYEYMSMRFHFSIRIFSSFMFTIQTLFFMAVVLIGPALAIKAVLGVDIWITIIISGVVCTVYTTLGGMRAVIWTDVFQFLVIFGTILVVFIVGSMRAGGFDHVWNYNAQNDRINLFEFPWDVTVRLSFFNLVIGFGFLDFNILLNQTSIQRYATAKTVGHAQNTVSSGLSSVIAMTLEDIIKPWRRFRSRQTGQPVVENDFRDTVISKILNILYVVLNCLITFIIGILASELVRCLSKTQREQKVDPKLLIAYLRPSEDANSQTSVNNLNVHEDKDGKLGHYNEAVTSDTAL